MSRRQRRGGRSTPRVDRTTVEAAAALAALVAGCECGFSVRVAHDPSGPRALIGHDDDCPAINAPSLWVTLDARKDNGRHG